ncbi:glycoside hydrolase family 2 TIM barrel-domain containing protein [Pedobacter miscanthi]|jgi:beta-galactosidase|uniref:glycoside hydrolase family 2 TIM barrel-domain containing protein n=1 Tax=Pedobacter miscanthi TaxID=2259170 RepID=UPI00292EADC3|nr:glycoside hydrolase family 2 TIM barrel-domain containing protein [Pedobacter miscanthi]
MKQLNLTLTILFCLFPFISLHAQNSINEGFETAHKLETTGSGTAKIEKGVLKTKAIDVAFGDATASDYEVSFKARTPQNEKQVQIWAGFRASSRNDKYIIGLRGGIQNDLYLARLGYMGTDDHLALRHLDFNLIPGQWYNLRIQVVGNRIKVFLDNKTLPLIDVKDPYTEFSPNGKVILGGSWLANEFDDLSIKPLPADAFKNDKVQEFAAPLINKSQKRIQERSAYKSVKLNVLSKGRTNLSLTGKWLFAPGYEISDAQKAISPENNDENWHVMTVPQFWNPNREWLHGEKYNTASKGVADNHYQKEIERCEAYTFDYKKTDVGYYRQWIELPADVAGKNLELDFDAVSKVGEVFINGKKANEAHIGMFGAFKVEGTGLFKPGKNLIVVKVSRDFVKDIKDADKITDVAVTVPITNKMIKDLAHGFYNDDPAGIWQPVSLVISDPLKITDVFIKPNLTGADIEVTVKNNTAKNSVFNLSTSIVENKDLRALFSGDALKDQSLHAGEEKVFKYNITGLKPKLWSPATPNIYNFSFIIAKNKQETDRLTIESGFRTFTAKGDYFYLNNKPYWLRGGNHTPMSLAPNDTLLANAFSKLMHEGNIAITRTHTAPYSEVWMNASDHQGVGVSYEGGWPWLMINSSMPDAKLIDLWKNEFFDLIKKYRNHPSLLFWTVNNEMKFYDNDPDLERAKLKMKIISDVVKKMREIDPTRPISFDSNYTRKEKKFGKDFYTNIDDGDIDDQHWYLNWYHGSVFSEFNGEWQQRFKNPGRPLISQEFSTGYPSETGHPTRFYTYVHQNPSSLVGNYAYEYADPKYFLEAQSFITRESAEAVRRTNDKAAGILHFAALTWFSNIEDAKLLKPERTYYQMKKALQPVLVSAELWGRHFYAGATLPVRFYLVNDSEDGNAIAQSTIQWSIEDQNGKVLKEGKETVPPVDYYGRKWIAPKISLPENLSSAKTAAKLVIKLIEKGKEISANDYEITIADKNYISATGLNGKKIVLLDQSGKIAPLAANSGINVIAVASFDAAVKQKPDVLILSGMDSVNTSAATAAAIRNFVKDGGKLLLFNSGSLASVIFPEQIRSMVKEQGEIVSMEIPESNVFKGIEPMELRYFNNNERQNPTVSAGAYRINRNSGVEALAAFTKVHGYLEGNIYQRTKSLDAIRGFPIVKITDKGTAILSEMLLSKGNTDPIAAKLFVNMVEELRLKLKD